MHDKANLDPRNWSDLPDWGDLPGFMKNEEVRPYYDALKRHRIGLKLKRAFDLVVAWILLVILAIPMTVIAIMIKLDSPGPVFYRQERVTTYGKVFKIHKFRTMVQNADKIGAAVTVSGDNRITKVGKKLRDLRLDETAQLFDVIEGEKDIIGTTKKNLDFMGFQRLEVSPVMKFYARAPGQDKSQHEDQNEIRWLLDCPILTPIL